MATANRTHELNDRYYRMQILEYDEVDPLAVLHLNLLALEFALTPEHAAHIRRADPRPFPFFAIYAVEQGQVLGQVGVFRLPMITTEGREDVGGVWAVSTHPQHAGRGIASLLLEEAHTRMRKAGLRFSTLGTNRYRVAHKLYQQHDYEDMGVQATALATWEMAHQPTRLVALSAGSEGYDLIERIYDDVAPAYLGYAWRHTPFAILRDKVSNADLWVLQENGHYVGYTIAHLEKNILNISSVLLCEGVQMVEAVAAVANGLKSKYVRVQVSRPVEIASLRQAGFQVAHPAWDAFMLKPLTPEMTHEYARRLFGIGTDRFLISWLDTT
jgi:GNAT superfamily N-acetyltransferase